MELLTLVASLTQRRVIVSEDITTPINVAPFAQGDTISGVIRVVQETSDPTNPTTAVNVDTSDDNAVALTDGAGTSYADATITEITSGNRVAFELEVVSDALIAAMQAAQGGYINAFLEARITSDSQNILLLREAVIIWETAT